MPKHVKCDYRTELSDPVDRIDENRWTEQQISVLETGDLSSLDRSSLIEFLNAMVLREKRELQGRLTVVVGHFSKSSSNRLTSAAIGRTPF